MAGLCFWIFALLILFPGLLALAWYWYQRHSEQQNKESRLISLVGLLSEPLHLNERLLTQAVQRAWNPRLGEGPEDDFVVFDERGSILRFRRQYFMVLNTAAPYVEDVEQVAEQIPDLRRRHLLLQHRAWFSIDAMKVEQNPTPDRLRWIYHVIARLFLELADERCLLIYVPDTSQVFPVNEETLAALRAPHPLKALGEADDIPVIRVPAGDPQMQLAVKQARHRWPEFVAAFEARRGSHFAVKAPVTVGENTEFIWIAVTALEGDYIYGTLENDPVALGELKYGSRVRVPVAKLNDWIYFDENEHMVGGFTINVLGQRFKQDEEKPS